MSDMVEQESRPIEKSSENPMAGPSAPVRAPHGLGLGQTLDSFVRVPQLGDHQLQEQYNVLFLKAMGRYHAFWDLPPLDSLEEQSPSRPKAAAAKRRRDAAGRFQNFFTRCNSLPKLRAVSR